MAGPGREGQKALGNVARGDTGRTEVLDEDFARGGNALMAPHARLAVLERLFGRRVEEANTIEVANVGLLGNRNLEVLDRGLGR